MLLPYVKLWNEISLVARLIWECLRFLFFFINDVVSVECRLFGIETSLIIIMVSCQQPTILILSVLITTTEVIFCCWWWLLVSSCRFVVCFVVFVLFLFLCVFVFLLFFVVVVFFREKA